MIEMICEACKGVYTADRHRVARGSRFCSWPCRVKVVAEARRRPVADRFWEKVDKKTPAECWPWTGGKFADGYGAINVDGKAQRASRVCYEIVNGAFDPKMDVLHQCDNKICVNPLHLKLGTHAQNMADKAKRGRASRNIKLTDEQVQQVRDAAGPLADIAATFGVSKGLVALIRGKAAYRVKQPVAMSKRKEMMVLRAMKTN